MLSVLLRGHFTQNLSLFTQMMINLLKNDICFIQCTSLLPVLEQDMTMYEMIALHGHVPLFSFILSHSLTRTGLSTTV